ncbi:MAG: molecular chaperone HtpG [Candidatus Sericytochromatia bacterium]
MTEVKEKQAEEKGTISVNMENIFPIIKKWLYSDKDIFIRELVSNSVDAINKFKHLALIGEAKRPENDGEYSIQISVDKHNKTLTISDNGLGLTADEVKKYINQVAFSGATDFLNKYKSGNEKDQIIGHFGLGFYSSFMVSKKVEIDSLSYQDGAEAIKWECDGTPEFSLTTGKRKKRGTDITLFLNDDELEFLETERLNHLIKTYCDFLPYRIDVDGIVANKQKALWNDQPHSLKKEDYEEFYNYLYPYTGEPLFWIHMNVDYPFNLKGILYFPQLTHELDLNKGHIKLFCNNVYVSENTQELLPRFLTVLKGAIDSPDIPLNVSRSMLQNDPNVRKIATHIAKKVADRLKEMKRKEPESYHKIWDGIHPFVKVGIMEDDKFYDNVKEALIFKTTDDTYTTVEEYLEKNKDKTNNKVYYCSDKQSQSSYIQLFKSQGIDVLLLDSFIDSHFVGFLEMKNKDAKFARIDSGLDNNLLDKDSKAEVVDPKTNKTFSQTIEDAFKKNIGEIKVEVKNLKSADIPSMIVFDEQMRRIHEMSSMIQQKDLGAMKDYTLVINSNNPIIENLKSMVYAGDKDSEVELITNHVYELALLSQKQLPVEKMTTFLERSNKILELFSKK